MATELSKIVEEFMASGAKKWEGEWNAFEYKIYWAGTIIRIDLKAMIDS